MIFLTGATGHVGRHVTNALRGRSDVRALAHSDASAAVLAAAGFAVVRGDLREPEGLAAAFDGVSSLLLISPPAPRHEQLELAALDLAERGGALRHVVKLSSLGVEGNEPALLSQPHATVEERLGQAACTATFLRPPSFMTNLLNNAEEIRDGRLVMPAGQAQIPFVDPRDVAEVAAIALTDDAPPLGRVVVTGPELLTFGDVAAQLSRALGREVDYVDADPQEWRAYRVAAGVPPPLVEAIASLYESLQAGRAWPVGDTQQRLLGRPAHTLADWLAAEGVSMLEQAWAHG